MHPHFEGGPHGRRHHPHRGEWAGRPGRPGRPEGGPFGGPEGPFGRGRRHGGPRGPRGRAARGDVRAAVLLLLAEEPMHGYQLMQAIAERSGGRWTPSPGAIYPTLAQLEDEGLVTVTQESGRKLATLTDAGRAHVEERRGGWPDPFGGATGEGPGVDIRGLIEGLHGALRQVARSGTDEQIAAAAKILADARRSLYLLLADGPDQPQTPEA